MRIARGRCFFPFARLAMKKIAAKTAKNTAIAAAICPSLGRLSLQKLDMDSLLSTGRLCQVLNTNLLPWKLEQILDRTGEDKKSSPVLWSIYLTYQLVT